jgi:hypothetical protein
MSEGQEWRKRNVNAESEPIIGNRFSSGAAGQNNGCMKVSSQKGDQEKFDACIGLPRNRPCA